jgi:photosystem II stability/assembly factor-like uncharacterized protein
MSPLNKFVRGLGPIALMVALLFITHPSSAAENRNARYGSVVALAYAPGTHMLVKAYSRALYRSPDGGQSWEKINVPGLIEGQISSVTASSAAKNVMYVAGPGLGLLRTGDGGKTWVDRSHGLPSRHVIAVAAHTTQPDTVYAVVKDQGVYRSQDAGQSWRLMDRTAQPGLRQLIHSNMPGSMRTGWLFAATAKGVRRIMDCFCLWQTAGRLDSQAYAVTYEPKQPKHLYAATAKGLFRSADGGQNWVAITSPNSNIVALAYTPAGVLFAIAADGTLYESANEGNTWKQPHA